MKSAVNLTLATLNQNYMFSTRQNDAALKRISVSELRLGMYVCKLDGSWFQHPFWRDSFMLDKEQDRQKILASEIQDIWIDFSKSIISNEGSGRVASAWFRDESPVQDQPPAPDAAQPRSVPAAVSLLAEIQQARQICQAASFAALEVRGSGSILDVRGLSTILSLLSSQQPGASWLKARTSDLACFQ